MTRNDIEQRRNKTMSGPFEASFESLYQYRCPDWFRDAKFGIWSHWGPQSVPMYGDWYARNMYVEGSPQYLYHLRHYGHPSVFGYKDLVKLWHAENFDPDGLMELYYKSGARYFMSQATHHDHFFNYASKINRFNSVDVGPGKDICGLWQKAAQRFGMPFGMSEHLGASFSWWTVNKLADREGPFAGVPYDGNDPAYRDFYHDDFEYLDAVREHRNVEWYTQDPKYHAYWLACVKEMIDLYHPDLLYSDGGLPFAPLGRASTDDPLYETGLEFLSYYYNTAREANGEDAVVYLQKDRRPEIFRIGTLDIEKSQLTETAPEPWHTDTCIGNWFYDVRQTYKTPAHIVEMLVDIVAKNGCMLLNVLQRPDGTIDDQAKYILDEIGAWFRVNGEGIYGTRPWRVSAEGASRVDPTGFKESKVEWAPGDYRFTAKGNAVYAFLMAAPEDGEAVLRSFRERVRSVELLGYGRCEFAQPFGALNVRLPERLPSRFANCLKITL